MKATVKAAQALLVGILALGAGSIIVRHRNDTPPVTLTFQRDSNELDPSVHNVAFLWLTNTCQKSYLLTMVDGKNTLLDGNYIGWSEDRLSYLVNCVYQDKTVNGWTNWRQNPLPFRGSNAFLCLRPHSGIIIRVPLPLAGQTRKVAVLCEPDPQDSFWNGPIGKRILPFLPRRILIYVAQRIERAPSPIWCERELKMPADNESDL